MKPSKLIFFSILFALIKPAIADSISIENPDKLGVKLFYGDTLYAQNSDERSYDARNPKKGEEWLRVIFSNPKDSTILKELKLRTSSMNVGTSKGCNYSVLMTKHSGWKLEGSEKGGCSRSEDHYDANAPYAYTLKNNSNIPVYPAFSVEKKDDFSSDSILGYLKPGESRIYSTGTEYWKSIHVNDKVQVGFYNPYAVSYVPCSQNLDTIDGAHEFSFDENRACVKIK